MTNNAKLASLHVGTRTGSTVACTCGVTIVGDTPDDALFSHVEHAERYPSNEAMTAAALMADFPVDSTDEAAALAVGEMIARLTALHAYLTA